MLETVWVGIFKRELEELPRLEYDDFYNLYTEYTNKEYHSTNRNTNETLFKLQYEMAIALFTNKIQASELKEIKDVLGE